MKPLAAITGSTGFVGRYCVAALIEAGWRVRLLTRRDPAHPVLAGCDMETVLGDLADDDALAQLVRGADALVHAAGVVKAINAATFGQINRDATARLAATFAKAAPMGRFVLISSMAAREPTLSPYAASKREAEHAVIAAVPNWIIARPGVVYGPWDREGIAVLKLARRTFAPVPSPEPRIAMIHARDAASAVAALCGNGPAHATYELADGRPEGYLWHEILEAAAQGAGPRLIALPDAVSLAAGTAADLWAKISRRPTVFSRGKAREILHRDWSSSAARQPPPALFHPRISLDAGMAETVQWWEQQRRIVAPHPPGSPCQGAPLA